MKRVIPVEDNTVRMSFSELLGEKYVGLEDREGFRAFVPTNSWAPEYVATLRNGTTDLPLKNLYNDKDQTIYVFDSAQELTKWLGEDKHL